MFLIISTVMFFMIVLCLSTHTNSVDKDSWLTPLRFYINQQWKVTFKNTGGICTGTSVSLYAISTSSVISWLAPYLRIFIDF